MYRAVRTTCLLVLLLAAAGPTGAWEPDRAGFAVRFKGGQVSRHSVIGAFVLPGEALALAVEPQDAASWSWALDWVGPEAVATGRASWRWQAPAAAGLYPLRVVQRPSGRTMTFNVFVMVPATRLSGGDLNGYRVGDYPAHPYRGLPSYRPPRGFVEVTEALRGARIAPHFTLGQFVSRQQAPFPKYVALQERLVLKLELILEALAEAGHPADTLFIQSGYRTPFHNRVRGQGAYSRHIYGDAADIFVDRDRDGRMDDLDRNGVVDDADARALARLVEHLDHRPALAALSGGLGFYPATSAHGPYLHVDARGSLARWRAPVAPAVTASAQPAPAAPAP